MDLAKSFFVVEEELSCDRDRASQLSSRLVDNIKHIVFSIFGFHAASRRLILGSLHAISAPTVVGRAARAVPKPAALVVASHLFVRRIYPSALTPITLRHQFTKASGRSEGLAASRRVGSRRGSSFKLSRPLPTHPIGPSQTNSFTAEIRLISAFTSRSNYNQGCFPGLVGSDKADNDANQESNKTSSIYSYLRISRSKAVANLTQRIEPWHGSLIDLNVSRAA